MLRSDTMDHARAARHLDEGGRPTDFSPRGSNCPPRAFDKLLEAVERRGREAWAPERSTG